MIRLLTCLNVVFFTFLFVGSVYADESKLVVGWVEPVILFKGEGVMIAKLDSGAQMTSLHCGCEYFRKGDSTWARFNWTKNQRKQTVEVEVKAYTRIKRHGGTSQRRAVVNLFVCLGGIERAVDVNLIDRSGLEYKLLIGRDFLREGFLIDSSRKKLTKPECNTNE